MDTRSRLELALTTLDDLFPRKSQVGFLYTADGRSARVYFMDNKRTFESFDTKYEMREALKRQGAMILDVADVEFPVSMWLLGYLAGKALYRASHYVAVQQAENSFLEPKSDETLRNFRFLDVFYNLCGFTVHHIDRCNERHPLAITQEELAYFLNEGEDLDGSHISTNRNLKLANLQRAHTLYQNLGYKSISELSSKTFNRAVPLLEEYLHLPNTEW